MKNNWLMEMLIRWVLILLTPVIQIMLVTWRVQFKIVVSIGWTFIICLVLGLVLTIIASSIFPGSLSPCIGCAMAHGTDGLFVFFGGLLLDWLLNIIITLIALGEYRVAVKNTQYRQTEKTDELMNH